MENKRKYRHPYDDDTARFTSCVGNQFEVEEKLVIDGEGQWALEQVGVVDQQALIDASRESTDLKTMIERYKNSGDIGVLNRVRSGVFLDLSGAPENFAEYYQIIADAEAEFMSLPLSVREQHGHNPVQYFNAMLSQQRSSVPEVTPTVEPKGDVVIE